MSYQDVTWKNINFFTSFNNTLLIRIETLYLPHVSIIFSMGNFCSASTTHSLRLNLPCAEDLSGLVDASATSVSFGTVKPGATWWKNLPGFIHSNQENPDTLTWNFWFNMKMAASTLEQQPFSIEIMILEGKLRWFAASWLWFLGVSDSRMAKSLTFSWLKSVISSISVCFCTSGTCSFRL